MKILHIAPNAPYNEGWGYQENLITKYQARQGHSVTLVVRNQKHQNGKLVETPCENYMSKDGFRVIRVSAKRNKLHSMLSKVPVFDILCEEKPDFVFYHGLSNRAIFDVVKYKKYINPDCVIVQDNHLDYNIGPKFDSFRCKLVRAYYRMLNRKSQRYVERIYGVTPWRKAYSENYFKISPQKTDVLIMGADDEKLDFVHKNEIRDRIRKQYDINDDNFLIVTGGKIDKKKNIHMLMKAVENKQNVSLLVFGEPNGDFKDEFKKYFNDNVIYIGWIEAGNAYEYFFAADLVCFPGQHSVLWEQACAAKVPCLFEKWEGMEHVNNGGNAMFIEKPNIESLSQIIDNLKFTPTYYEMKKVAASDKTDIYLYSEIAKKSLECMK